MTHRLATNYAKNYCNRTPIVKVIVENVVTCFFETQCSNSVTIVTILIPFNLLPVRHNCLCRLVLVRDAHGYPDIRKYPDNKLSV